jgi:hypothetical protein
VTRLVSGTCLAQTTQLYPIVLLCEWDEYNRTTGRNSAVFADRAKER